MKIFYSNSGPKLVDISMTLCAVGLRQGQEATNKYAFTPTSDIAPRLAESEHYCHSGMFVCLYVCLSVFPRPTAYHD